PISQVVPILTAALSAEKPTDASIIGPIAGEPSTGTDDETDQSLVRDSFYIVQATDGDTLRFNIKTKGHIKAPAEFPSESVNLVRAMSTLGVTFKKVSSFIKRSCSDLGRVQQAFVSALQAQITLYYRLLAVLEAQNNSEQRLTLRQLFVWIQRPLKCMVALATIVDAVENRVGSSVLSLLEVGFSRFNGHH
ncbi:hypothetical protein BVRB_032820, partial [Beta vulgaris subsp. vulgaris]